MKLWIRFISRTIIHTKESTEGSRKEDKTDNARITKHRRFRESLLPWKSNKYYILVCVRALECVFSGEWACACACVHVALLIQHATRMRHIVTSFVAPQSPPHFSTLSHKWHDLRKKVTDHKMRVLIFSTTFIRNISNSKKNSARYCHKCENFFM